MEEQQKLAQISTIYNPEIAAEIPDEMSVSEWNTFLNKVTDYSRLDKQDIKFIVDNNLSNVLKWIFSHDDEDVLILRSIGSHILTAKNPEFILQFYNPKHTNVKPSFFFQLIMKEKTVDDFLLLMNNYEIDLNDLESVRKFFQSNKFVFNDVMRLTNYEKELENISSFQKHMLESSLLAFNLELFDYLQHLYHTEIQFKSLDSFISLVNYIFIRNNDRKDLSEFIDYMIQFPIYKEILTALHGEFTENIDDSIIFFWMNVLGIFIKYHANKYFLDMFSFFVSKYNFIVTEKRLLQLIEDCINCNNLTIYKYILDYVIINNFSTESQVLYKSFLDSERPDIVSNLKGTLENGHLEFTEYLVEKEVLSAEIKDDFYMNGIGTILETTYYAAYSDNLQYVLYLSDKFDQKIKDMNYKYIIILVSKEKYNIVNYYMHVTNMAPVQLFAYVIMEYQKEYPRLNNPLYVFIENYHAKYNLPKEHLIFGFLADPRLYDIKPCDIKHIKNLLRKFHTPYLISDEIIDSTLNPNHKKVLNLFR